MFFRFISSSWDKQVHMWDTETSDILVSFGIFYYSVFQHVSIERKKNKKQRSYLYYSVFPVYTLVMGRRQRKTERARLEIGELHCMYIVYTWL